MKRLAVVIASVLLIAATPGEALPGLVANGYFIEDGSSVSEQLVSDAVFEGRADGGRLYIVVLAEEPPGGATTFSDSTLDLLDGDGYVVTVAPETVGFAADETVWSADEMNAAVDASLGGGSDDEVVELFIGALIGQSSGGSGEPEAGGSSGGGISILWVLAIGAAAFGVWIFMSRRSRQKRIAGHMEEIRTLAKEKLDEVANDILELEDEVAVSDSAEVKAHYQRASEMYSRAMEDNTRASSVREMLAVSEELDLAIWELDCAEALIDGKPIPPKPEPPKPDPVPPPPPSSPEKHGTLPASVPGTVDQFDRRPQRQSSGSNEMLTMLMTMMAMGGMRGRGGGFGGFGGGGRRLGGGGRRMGGGGGRIRGGGRRG